jgi:heat shock protein HslJ
MPALSRLQAITMNHTFRARYLTFFFICFALAVLPGCENGGGNGGGNEIATPNSSITGVTWNLVQLNGKPASTGTDERLVTMMLNANDQSASGFSGCNRYSGSYDQQNTIFSLGPIASTRMFCEGSMDLEDEFLSALDEVTSITPDESALSLLDRDGTIIAKFVRPE